MKDKPLETMIKLAYNGSVYPSVEQVIEIFHNYPIDEETNIEKKKELFIGLIKYKNNVTFLYFYIFIFLAKIIFYKKNCFLLF